MTQPIPERYRDEITQCFEQHNEPLYRFLLFYAQGDSDLAQDTVQQAFIEVALGWAKFRELGAEEQKSFLQRVAIRRAIDVFRTNSVAKKHEPDVHARYRPPDADPQVHVVAIDAVERLKQIMNALPPRQAQVATLRWLSQWKNSEIADTLGISASDVSHLLDRARATIRRELGPCLPFEPGDPEGGSRS